MTALPSTSTRSSTVRLAVCAATIAACLPYACLKIIWLLGSGLGTADAEAAELMQSTEVRIANAVTLGLELGAMAVVAALTFGWGRRIPAAVMLVPMWIGSGLLTPLAVGLPAGLAVQAIAGGAPAPDENGLHDWVYATVYGGFVLQAPLLTAAFVLYARDRWPWVFELRLAGVVPGPTLGLQRLLANCAVAGGLLYAAAHVWWVAGGTGGPDGFETATQRTFLLVGGALPLAGAVAVCALVHRRGSRLLPGVVAGWMGSGVAFAAAPIPRGQSEAFFQVVAAMTGVGLAVAGLLVLVDARAGRPSWTRR